MAQYVDGFVIPIPKKNLAAYRSIARLAGRCWRKHGALDYRECAGDDLKIKGTASFLRMARCKPGETVVFSWIVYKSRAHRDLVNKRVMNDPQLLKAMKSRKMPFDVKRMGYGGFRVIVKA
jgi:uncharacterized protein YbaA (DUF1428 family)